MDEETDSVRLQGLKIEFLQEQLTMNIIHKTVERSGIHCIELMIMLIFPTTFYQLWVLSGNPLSQIIFLISVVGWILGLVYLILRYGLMDDEKYCEEIFREI